MARTVRFLMALVVAMGLVFPIHAFAAQDASLTLNITHTAQGKTSQIEGVTATAYKVADLDEAINNYTLTDEFSKLDVNFNEGLDDAATMESLAQSALKLAESSGLKGQAATSGSDGVASFGTLPYGVYLVAQSGAKGDALNYEEFTPFLISVPQLREDEIVYGVVCLPKLTPKASEKEPVKESEKEPEKESEKKSSTPTKPATPTNKTTTTTTPKTGDSIDLGLALICVLASGALVMFASRARNRKM